MQCVFILLLAISAAQASVSVIRTSNDGRHPTFMEIEVQLPETNKKARIPLIRTNILDNAPITVIENGIARTFSGEQAHHGDHAHYRDIKTKSTISVRIQNKDTRINGHVMHEGTAYFITNSSVAKTAGSIKSHKINIDQVLSRKKRQGNQAATEYEVELLILCDHTVWNLFKTVYGNDDKALTELHFYYTHILNGMDTAFRNIGQPSISVKCVGLTVAKTLADVKWMSKSGPYYDTNAEVDFYYMMAYAKDKPADHVMAFTRSNIRFNEAGSEIAGVALFAGACSDQRLSIVKDEGLHSWGVAAHELAHSLGADHDDNKPQCEKWRKFIQTPVLSDYSIGDVANSYRFSKCSVEEMKSFLSTKNATCLKSRQSTAKAVLTSNASEGARLTLDQVCRLAFPSTPGHFYLQTASLMTPAAICAKIHCSLTELALKPVTKSGLRAPVGTPCGNKRSCNWNGQCTADFAAPSAGSSFWGNQLVSSLCSDFLKYVLGLIPKFGTAKALTVCYKLVRYCGSKKFFRLVCVRLAKQILN